MTDTHPILAASAMLVAGGFCPGVQYSIHSFSDAPFTLNTLVLIAVKRVFVPTPHKS